LYREKNVVVSVYGRQLVNRTVVNIMKTHRFVRAIEKSELYVEDTFAILEILAELDLNPVRIDIGKMSVQFKTGLEGNDLKAFVEKELSGVMSTGSEEKPVQRDVVLYGFGRIGRLMARILIEKASNFNGMHLRAIVVRKGSDDDLQKRASLLRRDSVHGSFQGTITVDEEDCSIIANGNVIKVIYASSPDSIDYTEYGIENAIIIDNTGIWRDEDGLGLHLKSKGTSNVILTAPGKGDIKNIVFGVNDHEVDNDRIISAASCTTNAISPVLKAINDKFGIINGHMETVHSYTNDQNLIDNYHKGARRGRSAPLNMVITDTGAAKAVSKAVPELEGKLTGNAIRVPTPNVSLAILNLNLEKEVTVEEINDYLCFMALHSPLQKQIDYSMSPELVSTDLVGSRYAGVVDSPSTIAVGNRTVLYVWYDNEFGYSIQVYRLLQKIAGISYPIIPTVEYTN
jgi:glyceraldehyde 3-phosphate dehydrogenase